MPSQPSKSAVPIEWSALEAGRDFANGLIRNAKGKLGTFMEPSKAPGAAAHFRVESTALTAPDMDMSMTKFAQQVSRDGVLLSKGTFEVLTSVRDAFMIGLHVAKQYEKASNLDQIIAEEGRGKIPPERQNEKLAKLNTMSAIAMYVAASYIVYELSKYKTAEVTALKLELPQGLPQLQYMTERVALGSMAFSLAAVLELSKMVETDIQYVKAAILFAKKVMEEMATRKDAFRFVEPFSDTTYLLRNTEFSVSGFVADVKVQSRASFTPTQMNTIVGNKDAKRMSRWLAQRVACYDLALQKNPVTEIGGFPHITMGSGDAGTGKTEIMKATATLIDEYCERRGAPFLLHLFPPNIISTFQGGSGERTVDWFNVLADPTRIMYAVIDDAEGSLQERSDHNTSSGQKEVVQVFLVKTEGTDSIQRGNYLIQIMTNLPDKIDLAVRSRVIMRFRIDGARTVEDFMDQGYLGMKRFKEMDPEFVNLKQPDGYEPLAAQAPMRTMGTLYINYNEPKESVVREVYGIADKQLSRKSAKFIPTVLWQFQQRYPNFTSRDYRNILTASNARVADFDLPEEWFDKPELFFDREYSFRVNALKDLMKKCMKGLSFAEVYDQETMKYLDNWVKIQDLGKEREIAQRVKDLEVEFAARSRLGKQ